MSEKETKALAEASMRVAQAAQWLDIPVTAAVATAKANLPLLRLAGTPPGNVTVEWRTGIDTADELRLAILEWRKACRVFEDATR